MASQTTYWVLSFAIWSVVAAIRPIAVLDQPGVPEGHVDEGQLREDWQQLANGASQWSGTIRYLNEEFSPGVLVGPNQAGQVSMRATITLVSLGTSWRMTVDILDNANPERVTDRSVFCVTDEYSFVLGQPARDGAYILKMFERGETGRTRTREKAQLFGWLSLRLSHGLPDELKTLVELSEDPEFDVRPTNTPGEPTSSLLLRYRPTGQGAKRDPSVREAAIIIDPTRSSRVVEARTKNSASTGHTQVTYSPAPADDYEVLRAVATVDFGILKVVETFSFERASDLEVVPESFTLSAFGLSEIPLSDETNNRLLWIIAGVSFTGGCAGTLIVWNRSRRRAAA